MDDILIEIFSHFDFDLVSLLKLRGISIDYNQRILTTLKNKLTLFARLNLNDYNLDELLHLTKIYIIKSRIFAYNTYSYIITDAATSPTTLSQVYMMGGMFTMTNTKPRLLSNFNDITYITRSTYFTAFLHDTGHVSIHHSMGNRITQLDITDITSIVSGKNDLIALNNKGDLYHIKFNEICFHFSNGIIEIKSCKIIMNNVRLLCGDINLFIIVGENNKLFYLFSGKDIAECEEQSDIRNISSLATNGNISIALSIYGDLFYIKNKEKIMNGVIKFCLSNDSIMILTKKGESYLYKSGNYKFIMDDIIDIATGKDHYLLLTANEDVYTFGGNSHGQLGTGDRVARTENTFVMNLKC